MKRGFTLIELLVTLAVFGILMIAGSSFLIEMIKGANQAKIQNEVRQNASAVLQDIVRQVRSSYCVYYVYPDNSDGGVVKLRLSDDPNGAMCNSGNIVEYRQDPTNNDWTVNKRSIPFGGAATAWLALSSQSITVADCSANGLACGSTSCYPGIVVTPAGTLTNGTPAQITVKAQQQTTQTRSDFCASVSLADTVTPRTK